MTRYINVEIESKVQVLDANSDPATGASVSYKIYDEADVLFSSGNMSHIADGIFTVAWTPDAVGTWTFEAYSTNPKFRDSRTYNVEAETAYAYKSTLTPDSHVPPVLDTWYTMYEETHGAWLMLCQVIQTNDETADKDIQVRVTLDGVVMTGADHTTSHGDTICIDLSNGIVNYQDGAKNAWFGGRVSDDGSVPYDSMALFCHSIKIEYRLRSAAGTNQTLTGGFGGATLEKVTFS